MLFQNTYKWKVSLNFGDQLLLLDFVECFRRLSLRCGPIRLTSTKGRNMPVVCHFRLLAATTVQIRGYVDINEYTPRVVGHISIEIKYKTQTSTLLLTWPDMHKHACSFFDKNVTERKVSLSWYTVYMYIYVHVPIVRTKILILALKTLINPVLFFLNAKCTLQVVDTCIFMYMSQDLRLLVIWPNYPYGDIVPCLPYLWWWPCACPTFGGDLVLPCPRVSEQVHLNGHLAHGILQRGLVLGGLGADKRFDECVCGLCIQGQGIT